MRLLIRLFTLALAILAYWLLGFLVQDIESIRGPDYAEVERRFVDVKLVANLKQVESQRAELERQLGNAREQQRQVADGSQNLQRTINQLLELQKLSLEKQVALPAADSGNLSVSLARFLDSQKQYQELNAGIADQTARKLAWDEERRVLEQQIERQRDPARAEFARLQQAHRLRLAAYQLAILIPLLLIGALLVIRRRGSIYFPLMLAYAGATGMKVALVVHEYFPSRYFKYALILVLLGVVARLLIHFIRMIAFPKSEWLLRQYRESYERFLCPVCDYPIRTGPRRFLYWTRRTVHKVLPPSSADAGGDLRYSCPHCGTRLFETCANCGSVRHALLPHCAHCGQAQAIEPAPAP